MLPIALAHGDVFGMSATGWAFTAILTLTSGIAAQGLLVYAQKTIQIGTIGISQQLQPALAVVWSYLLLGEVINGRQAPGSRSSSRGSRRSSWCTSGAVGPVALRDEVRRGLHAAVGVLVASERVEREHLDRRVAVAAGGVEQRLEPLAAPGTPSAASSAASRQSPSAACSPPPALAVERGGALERRARLGVAAERPQDAAEVDPAEGGQPDVAGRLRLGRSRRASVAAPAS